MLKKNINVVISARGVDDDTQPKNIGHQHKDFLVLLIFYKAKDWVLNETYFDINANMPSL